MVHGSSRTAGEKTGEKNGYFYLSYQDGSINNLVAASATNQPKYTNNYFYDGTCGLSALAMYAGDKIASVSVLLQER